MDFEQTIRERAYFIWLAADCELGNADAHWLAAEADILSAAMEAAGRVMAAPDKAGANSWMMEPKTKRRAVGKVSGDSGRARKASAPTKDAKKFAPRKGAKSLS